MFIKWQLFYSSCLLSNHTEKVTPSHFHSSISSVLQQTNCGQSYMPFKQGSTISVMWCWVTDLSYSFFFYLIFGITATWPWYASLKNWVFFLGASAWSLVYTYFFLISNYPHLSVFSVCQGMTRSPFNLIFQLFYFIYIFFRVSEPVLNCLCTFKNVQAFDQVNECKNV